MIDAMPGDGADGFAGAAHRFAADLQGWRPSGERLESWRVECLGLVQAGQGAALDRTRCRDHVTASCFVLSPDLGQVLLTLHRKVGLWLQLGGHLQAGDATVIDAARREAREESGIAGLDVATHDLVDLERQDVGHALTACSVHWDAGYLAIADRRTPTIISAESRQLQWWPIAQLPADVPPTLAQRIARAVEVAAGLLG